MSYLLSEDSAKKLKRSLRSLVDRKGTSDASLNNEFFQPFMLKTPSGGIPGCTGTGPWTPGSATCLLCEKYLDSGVKKWRVTDIEIEVFNSISSAIAGNTLAQGKWINGERFVDVAECA